MPLYFAIYMNIIIEYKIIILKEKKTYTFVII